MSESPSLLRVSTVLVDDEPVAIERLRNQLQIFPQIDIIGTASDGLSAIKLINSQCPELVFLDIQMPEINGFGVISQLTCSPLIVFVTAFDEYAVMAFEKNSVDYLLKPVVSERLAVTIKRVFDRKQLKDSVFEIIKSIALGSQEVTPKISTIPVKTGSKIHLVAVEDIYYFQAMDKYVYLNTANEKKLLDNSLSYLESRLPEQFIRVQRSFIINKHKIKEIQKYFKGGFIFILSDVNSSRIKSTSKFIEAIRDRLLLI